MRFPADDWQMDMRKAARQRLVPMANERRDPRVLTTPLGARKMAAIFSGASTMSVELQRSDRMGFGVRVAGVFFILVFMVYFLLFAAL
jgi:hypothetical protein